MSVPGIVQSRLDGEQVAAEVSLGGEDGLYVTRTQTLIYRADGLLSDESVEEYPHDAERIEISEGRRKSAVELDYGIDGEERFKIPSDRLYEALHPVLAGVLNAADVTSAEETVKQTYQFSELTLVITSERVVKHVGAAVWDEDYEEYHFDDVTGLDVEEGNVSSQIIIESEGRPQRIKTPSDQTREVRERIERALLDYHGLSSYEEFAREHADPEDHAEAEREREEADAGSEDDGDDPLAGGGVDPIDADPPELDEDGAIIEDEVSMTTDERDGAEESEVEVDDAEASAESAGNADGGAEATNDVETNDEAATAAAASATESTEGVERDGAESTGAQADDGASASEDAATHDASAGGEAGQSASAEGTALTADRADASGAATATGTATDAGDEPGDSDGFADSGFESASSELTADATEEQLEALTEAVQQQNELLAEQQRTLERLIEELNRGR